MKPYHNHLCTVGNYYMLRNQEYHVQLLKPTFQLHQLFPTIPYYDILSVQSTKFGLAYGLICMVIRSNSGQFKCVLFTIANT